MKPRRLGKLTAWDRAAIAGRREITSDDCKAALTRTLAAMGDLPKRWRLQSSTVAYDGMDGRDVRFASNVAAWERMKAERAASEADSTVLPLNVRTPRVQSRSAR